MITDHARPGDRPYLHLRLLAECSPRYHPLIARLAPDPCPHLHAARACTLSILYCISILRVAATLAVSTPLCPLLNSPSLHIALFVLTVTLLYPFAPATALCPLSLWLCSLVLVFALAQTYPFSRRQFLLV
ncbi:hypothetical protein BKA62DRAFT_719311 [Auriculariales sp. MPI-PUGE-AT-0066]|nr:hypothetical protein BKA62DRAFT_719311 [Auriculariales sp. MPI-PUGE-AT-0066]